MESHFKFWFWLWNSRNLHLAGVFPGCGASFGLPQSQLSHAHWHLSLVQVQSKTNRTKCYFSILAVFSGKWKKKGEKNYIIHLLVPQVHGILSKFNFPRNILTRNILTICFARYRFLFISSVASTVMTDESGKNWIKKQTVWCFVLNG